MKKNPLSGFVTKITDIQSDLGNTKDFTDVKKAFCQTANTICSSVAKTLNEVNVFYHRQAEKYAFRQQNPPIICSKSSPINVNLYLRTTGKTCKTILIIFAGGNILFWGLCFCTAGIGLFPVMIIGIILSLWGVRLLGKGIKEYKFIKRFNSYCALLRDKTTISISRLANAIGKSEEYVTQDLQKMIDCGYFLEGHLDCEGTILITSDESFLLFEQSRVAIEDFLRKEEKVVKKSTVKKVTSNCKSGAEKKRKEKTVEEEKKPVENIVSEQKKDKDVENPVSQGSQPQSPNQLFLEKGNAFILELQNYNSLISNDAISKKIRRIEVLVKNLLFRAEKNPAAISSLKHLMDYYLPLTVKLLRTYSDMEKNPVQSDSILASKREIEKTLDTLNQAFEKMLDQLYMDVVVDLNSDISVLNAMLAKEGLAEDELSKMRKTIL